MVGHSGYLIREYDHLNPEEKLEMYIELEPELLIDNTQRLKAENEKLEKEKSELEKIELDLEENKKTRKNVEKILKYLDI